ncbi:phosphatidylethanolamine-binding protein 4 isoform X3 [Columba livia]|uniref:phosphatidylethanolamine-binding protein 4 isoform X3 n=1 Tax=Columba livia TaxID=8932 RepID=UPI0031BB57AC
MDEKCEGMCLSHLITSTFCKSLAISPTACGIKHSRRCQGRMKLLGAVLLGAVLLSSPAQLSKPEEQPQVCYFDVLSGRDSRFCRGELQVIYPDVGDVSCIYMPKCHQYRWRIIRDWMRPRVRFPQADENKKYVLVLADPDTPSREKPWNQYWRHWLVADIPGAELRSGDIKGRVLSDYIRPTPTPRSGYHRYQFRLYRQPANATIALTREESISFFRWPLMKFVKKYRMGSPVAATQFLTKHYED